MTSHRRILLAARPHGMVTEDCLRRVEEPVPVPAAGEVLLRVLSLSVDPTNRVWMREADSYLPAVEIGEVVRAAGIAQVVESRREGFAPGDLVLGMPGWQDYWLLQGDDLANVVPPGLEINDLLSIYGSTGVTAWFGIEDVCDLQPGEVVVVSGAAGGVGSVAGQLAKIKGAGLVVGIAGSDEKCRWVVDELGFDACINYKAESVPDRLAALCPDGIDVYFDNVGGEILEAVLGNLAVGARIACCGAISTYNADEPVGVRNTDNLIMKRARMQGFLILDYVDQFLDAILGLAPLVAEGRITYATQEVDGLEHAPETLNRLFTGDHTGKLIVKVADPT
ncbi:MAG: NADP-dependent oxidoreductase [Acidimicrobiia bacterium]|nr:NADP-dependent oxidoreductase [Acidimicrobiia bacterium]